MNQSNLSPIQSLGQVWTPEPLARTMATECLKLNSSVRNILDPASGPGTFSKAFFDVGAREIDITCYDVDRRMAEATKAIHQKFDIQGAVYQKNYLLERSNHNNYDLIIMNPPYIRQELIAPSLKSHYHDYIQKEFAVNIGKRANLFTFFLLKAINEIRPFGLLCALVYDAISQTRYGLNTLHVLEKYAEQISLINVKTPFQGVLVDAQVMFYQKRQHCIKIKNVSKKPLAGYTPLHNLLIARRGTGLPSRSLFLANEGDLFYDQATPLFMKQSTLKDLIVKPDQKAYLVNQKNKTEQDIVNWIYAQSKSMNYALKRVSVSKVTGPIVFNYYLRNSPRHLWNPHLFFVSDNFYASSTIDNFPEEVAWLLLNSSLYLDRILAVARNQGNGLSKLQLYEYKSVQVPDWRLLTSERVRDLMGVAQTLIVKNPTYETVRLTANQITRGLFNS